MNKNLTSLRKAGFKSFDEYWASRRDPSAVTAWEEALRECEEAFRQERDDLIGVIDILSREVLKLSPGNELAKDVRKVLELDKWRDGGS